MALTRPTTKLTLDGARIILAAAEAKAAGIGVDMDIAIVDDAMHLLAFHRMDGAKLTSIDVAIGKAYTAAGTRLPTANYAESAKAGGPAFGINVSNAGKFMIVKGGLPIKLPTGETIGAVGCSSGSGEQDTEVSQAGIDALLAALASEQQTNG
ncbi:MAG: heme-binding protein [Capsulimonadaceae bacterium]|nr:heme-binding protein [Capsulimonadaceae bacterium]